MAGERALAELVELMVDGTRPLTVMEVKAVNDVCDRCEDGDATVLVLRVQGAPSAVTAVDMRVLTQWEGALRRLERMPALSVALAGASCGGLALDALLAADYRIAAAGVQLVPSMAAGGVWPGMALYRLGSVSCAAAVRRAVYFGVPIGLDEALACGLVDELAAAAVLEEPSSVVSRLTARLQAPWGAGLAMRRALLHESASTDFEGALGVHLAACDRELRMAGGTR
ncbi:enoyl-CoA-hydratase DpgB [Streptomyces sp. NPDC005132]|uniref:enoyl-CoA-hydratase DpgB n=1 Tax=Streptomyces sp. NPDC005132 TaxID=3154294 RepID=UPI0033BD1DF9